MSRTRRKVSINFEFSNYRTRWQYDDEGNKFKSDYVRHNFVKIIPSKLVDSWIGRDIDYILSDFKKYITSKNKCVNIHPITKSWLLRRYEIMRKHYFNEDGILEKKETKKFKYKPSIKSFTPIGHDRWRIKAEAHIGRLINNKHLMIFYSDALKQVTPEIPLYCTNNEFKKAKERYYANKEICDNIMSGNYNDWYNSGVYQALTKIGIRKECHHFENGTQVIPEVKVENKYVRSKYIFLTKDNKLCSIADNKYGVFKGPVIFKIHINGKFKYFIGTANHENIVTSKSDYFDTKSDANSYIRKLEEEQRQKSIEYLKKYYYGNFSEIAKQKAKEALTLLKYKFNGDN